MKIGDFGYSKEVDCILKSVAGTPTYMSPEQYSGKNYTEATDLW